MNTGYNKQSSERAGDGVKINGRWVSKVCIFVEVQFG